MLMGTNEENCQIVIDRIIKSFSQEHKAWARYLDCSVSSLFDYRADDDALGIHFGESIF